MSVVKLVQPTQLPMAPDEMKAWFNEWLDGFVSGDFGNLNTIIVVAENTKGQLGIVSQSVGPLDRARLVGLLHYAAHERMEGRASPFDMNT